MLFLNYFRAINIELWRSRVGIPTVLSGFVSDFGAVLAFEIVGASGVLDSGFSVR